MTLEDRQRTLEDEYTNQGIADAIKKWQDDLAAGRLAETNVGKRLTLRLYTMLETELNNTCNAGTRGVGGRYRRLLREIGLDICAVIGIRTALSMYGSMRGRMGEPRVPVTQDFISEVGNDLELEHMHKKLSIVAPGYMHRVNKSLDEARTKSTNHRKRTFKAVAENVQAGAVSWTLLEKNGAASLILQAMIDASMLELVHLPKHGGQVWVGIRCPDNIEKYVEAASRQVRAFVRYPPMLVPPKPHTLDTLFTGASYLTEGMSKQCSTITTRAHRADYRDWIRANMQQSALDAANRAASVQYRIDTQVLAMLQSVFADPAYHGVCGIPSLEPIKPPPYPHGAEWNREDPALMEQHEAWKAEAKAAHSADLVRRSHVMFFSQITKYMREFSEDVLYFPTYFDWRGRLYFRSRINPQGADFVKASLRFANARALGTRGLFWLKVHIANCFGFDKPRFDVRAAWVDQNLDALRVVLQDNVDSELMQKADSPWCFYTAVRELFAALNSGSPETYQSSLPVAMDATCSGMQHLSALLRDPIGGGFTNLYDGGGENKADIYAGVADMAVKLVQSDRENPEQGQYWLLNGITRAMAKRPVMTYVYGGTITSCTEYVYNSAKDEGKVGLENYSLFKLAAYISGKLRGGIEVVVPAVAEGMRFLRSLSGMMPQHTAMRWVSPVGFPALQHYSTESSIRMDMKGIGTMITMVTYNDQEIDRRKATNGIAPNFVHSLDSAHLCLTLNAFQGDIIPIHDSFATHACDVDAMQYVLRDVFAKMYEQHDPLAVLVQGVQQYCDEVIELPKKGSLDVSKVRDSEFFMC